MIVFLPLVEPVCTISYFSYSSLTPPTSHSSQYTQPTHTTPLPSSVHSHHFYHFTPPLSNLLYIRCLPVFSSANLPVTTPLSTYFNAFLYLHSNIERLPFPLLVNAPHPSAIPLPYQSATPPLPTIDTRGTHKVFHSNPSSTTAITDLQATHPQGFGQVLPECSACA